MNRELTEEVNVTAGVKNPDIHQVESGELSLDELDNILGEAPRAVAYEKAMEHPELYREKSLDKLVEEQIRREEMEAAREQSLNNGMKR